MSNVKHSPGRDKSQVWNVYCWPAGSGDRRDGRGPGAGPPKCPCCREYLTLCRETATHIWFSRCLNCHWESPGHPVRKRAIHMANLAASLGSP